MKKLKAWAKEFEYVWKPVAEVGFGAAVVALTVAVQIITAGGFEAVVTDPKAWAIGIAAGAGRAGYVALRVGLKALAVKVVGEATKPVG